jgi:hypothetical protein
MLLNIVEDQFPVLDSAWQDVESTLYDHYYEPDVEAARALYSAIAAHYLPGPAVWPMIVAPPGSMKTELVQAMDGLPRLHLIDRLTQNSFISGQIDDKGKPRNGSASLLQRIGTDGIIVYPDFSTILSMKSEARGSILAQMRRIYDGRLRNEYGTSENLADRSWTGRITFAVATTPDVDQQYSMFQVLGERFVMVRWKRPNGVEAALCAMNQDRASTQRELRQAVNSLLVGLDQTEPSVSCEFQRRIAALSEFAVRARTHVPREGYSKTVIYEPEAEAPTRMAQQLIQLTKGSAMLDRRRMVDDDDFKIAKRAAFDSIPASRRKIIDAIIAEQSTKLAFVAKSTRVYAVEDLAIQGLVTNDRLSNLATDLLQTAAII